MFHPFAFIINFEEKSMSKTFALSCLGAAILCVSVPAFAADDQPVGGAAAEAPAAVTDAKPAEEAKPADVKAEADITVPASGTPEEYMAFMEKIMQIEKPATEDRNELIAFFTKLCKAQIGAADKIIAHKDATDEQIQRALSAKINCLRILMQTGDATAEDQLNGLPAQLRAAGQDKIADQIELGLTSLQLQKAVQTKDVDAIKKIIAATDEKVKAAKGDKDALQSLYMIKLAAIQALLAATEDKTDALMNDFLAELKEAGMDGMITDISLAQIAKELNAAAQAEDLEAFKKVEAKVSEILEKNTDNLTTKNGALAFQTAFTAESIGETKLAAELFQKYGDLLSKAKDAEVVKMSASLLGAARRLNLVGNTMVIAGKTTDGKNFDIASLKDKIVLVDFWATWCGPCMQEIGNLENLYKFYASKGFEIVGVSLDENKEDLDKFLGDAKLGWPIMPDADTKAGDVTMSEYYGVIAIPCMILIGKDGKVVSIDARGETLEKYLAEQLGPMPKEEPKTPELPEIPDAIKNMLKAQQK